MSARGMEDLIISYHAILEDAASDIGPSSYVQQPLILFQCSPPVLANIRHSPYLHLLQACMDGVELSSVTTPRSSLASRAPEKYFKTYHSRGPPDRYHAL